MPSTPLAPFPFISVSGSPLERGRAYGAAARDRVQRSISIYGDQLTDLGFSPDAASALIQDFIPGIAAFGAHYLEEMQGIAEGAGVALEQIVLINARTEVVAKARVIAGVPEDDETDDITKKDGCTGVVVLPDQAASGRLIHAQNWDWRAECAETAVVLRVQRDDGPDFMTFVEAGGLARCGMNAAGIAITANYLESNRDYTQSGVPLALIRRKVLEQTHLAFAMKAVATTAKACSNNMIVSHAEGFAIDFECAPDETFPLYPDNGLIVHANHWQSPVALSKLKDTGIPSVPESFYRDWRVRRLLESRPGPLSADDVKAALFDTFGTPHAVCRPPRPGSSGNLSATVAMIVMDPAIGQMEVAPLPALNQTFTRYSFTADPVTA